MNQKKGIYKNYILYPLQLGPLFSNDAEMLRPKVSLESNQITNWLQRC